MHNQKQVKPYYIYNKSFTFEDASAIIGFAALIFAFSFSEIGIYFTPLLLFIAYYLYRLSKRIQTREPQIIINHFGIRAASGHKIPWDVIEHAFVAFINPTSKNRTYGLFVHLKNEKITISLSDYLYDREKIKSAVEYFSKRDIGDADDKLRDDVEKIIGKEMDTVEVMRIFKSYSNWGAFFTIMIMIICVGIGIYFQVAYRYWFAIGLGFMATVMLLYYMIQLIMKLAQKRDLLKHLSIEQIHKLAVLYHISAGSKMNAKNVISFSVISLIIMIANYFINQNL